MQLKNNQTGFITMIVILLAILIAAVALAYMRVKTHQQG